MSGNLCMKVLGMNLSHITAEAVCNSDRMAIINLTEIFGELSRIVFKLGKENKGRNEKYEVRDQQDHGYISESAQERELDSNNNAIADVPMEYDTETDEGEVRRRRYPPHYRKKEAEIQKPKDVPSGRNYMQI